MKNLFIVLLIAVGLSGCFRQEIVVSDYTVPSMKKQAAAQYLMGKIKQLTGVNEVVCDTETQVIRVTYNNDLVRFMNIEEAISKAGFSVNKRPADLAVKAKLPNELFAD